MREKTDVTGAVPAIMLVVLTTPFTVEVSVFVDVAKLIVFVVAPAIAPVRDVVLVTPFTFDTKSVPDVESVLLPITEDVAETPLIVVVRTFPERDCVNELIIFEAADAIPFTVVVNVFASEVKMFEVTVVVVACTPFTFVVKTLPDVVAPFVVPLTIPSVEVATHVGTPETIESTDPSAPGAVGCATFDAFPTRIFPSASGRVGSTENVVAPSVVVPFTVKLLFNKRFVPVALPNKSDVKLASVENKFVVVAFAATKFCTKEFVDVELVVLKFCTNAFVDVLFVVLELFATKFCIVVEPKFAAVRNGVTVAVTEVRRPCASTVIIGTVVDDPYVPADTPVLTSENTESCAVPVRLICPSVPVAVVSLLLKVAKSAAVSAPRFTSDADGILSV